MQKSIGEIQRQLNMVDQFAEVVQLDVCDGKFIPTDTMHDPDQLRFLQTSVDFEIHLMIEQPEQFLYRWLIHDNVKRVYIHVEAVKNEEKLHTIVKDMRNASRDVGLCLNIESTVKEIEPLLNAGVIDNVLLMAVHPGKQGQPHHPEVINKFYYIKERYPNVKVGIDGGINPVTAIPFVKGGIDILVAGSFIVKSENPRNAFKELEQLGRTIPLTPISHVEEA
jgi:ribulose-phosphate 3-epimerase